MGNIISLLQEIFMLKEDNSAKVGLSAFKEVKSPIERPQKKLLPLKNWNFLIWWERVVIKLFYSFENFDTL